MVDDFNLAYQSAIKSLLVPPMKVASGAQRSPSSTSPSSFVLGHLSNLSIDKGLCEVIETFERIAEVDCTARLVLAGPCHKPGDRDVLNRAVAKHAGRIEYRGAVYESAKVKFFREIDAFLFPTKIESWGIVLNEALSFGVPVISVRRACIPCLVGEGGVIISPELDFAKVAAQIVTKWISDVGSHRAACAAAYQRGRDLESKTASSMQALVNTIVGNEN